MTELATRSPDAAMAPLGEDATIAATIAAFAAGLRYSDVPEDVREQAKLLILDCIGIALASGTYDFAKRAKAAVGRLVGGGAAGTGAVIGERNRLPMRDAILLNGLLIHGLDYDDTHPGGIVHASASAFPTALGVAEDHGQSGRDVLLGYVLGMEVTTRLGMAADGGFHQVGFHPTGLIGAFGAAVLAARLQGLPASAIALAQGFVGSQAAGSLEFLETGAWTKRLHPGWAGVCGTTAAAFAAEGYEAPPRIYEGRFGLYRSHLGEDAEVHLDRCTDGLGERWETMAVAVKPYPACHFTHAFADAVIAVCGEHGVTPSDVERVHCLIGEGAISTVCEPAARKRNPGSSYDAQFSLPYVVSAALHRGGFTLDELSDDALTDPDILSLAQRVTYEADPESGFPELFSGEVHVHMHDGRVLRHREQVNRGAGTRPLSADDIRGKFLTNAGRALAPERAERVMAATLALDGFDDAREFGKVLCA
jgi:2-methylcitrate dehydratase PrpD